MMFLGVVCAFAFALSSAAFDGPEAATFTRQPAAAGGGGGATYLVSEDFEGTGYDGGFTDSAGSPDEDYATSPAPLVGSQSLLLDGTAASVSSISPNFGDQFSFSHYFVLHVVTLPGSTGREIVRYLLNGSQSGGSELTVNSAGTLTIAVGTTTIPTTTTVSAGSSYHVWVEYQAESVEGAGDGIGQVAFAPVSGDGVKPTSDGGGKGWGRRTTMNGELAVDQFWMTAQFSTTGPSVIVDKIRVDDVEIGSNPP